MHTSRKNPTKTFSGAGITSIINEHNDRVDLKRNRTHTKTFIGGAITGMIILQVIQFIIFPLADYLTDTLLAYLMK